MKPAKGWRRFRKDPRYTHNRSEGLTGRRNGGSSLQGDPPARIWWQDGTTPESMLDMPRDRAGVLRLNAIAAAVEAAFGGYVPFSIRYGIANEVHRALDAPTEDEIRRYEREYAAIKSTDYGSDRA